MNVRKLLFAALLALCGLLGGILIGNRYFASEPPPKITGILLPQPLELPAFTLTDQDGQPFGPERLRGKWSLLYFGYTYCPDVCPTALTDLAAVQAALAEKGQDGDMAYWLVTIDPQRDTPARLREYVRFFSPRFAGATGSEAELRKLMAQFGVIAMRAPGSSDGAYTVDHSSTLTLIDPDGRLHAVFTAPHSPDTVLPDLLALKARYAAAH